MTGARVRSAVAALAWVLAGPACGGSNSDGDGGGGAGGGAGAGGGGAGGGAGAGGGGGGGGGACPADRKAEPGLVVVESGAVRGVRDGETWSYKAIPFAAPPVGPLRWRPPARPACFAGERDGSAFAPVCAQMAEDGTVVGAEDCLYLNVWAPAAPSAEPRPVLVFVHGGGNVQGSSHVVAKDGSLVYDGRKLAERGPAIVVTVAYRLGPFGFLAHPALSAESDVRASGNYGLLDQIEALRWIARNAAALGADPSRVMIFGESAGAVNVCSLVASPLSAGLFQRALMESGGCVARPLAELEEVGRSRYAVAAGCGTGADAGPCLRALSTEAAVRAEPGEASVVGSREAYPYGAAVDGWVLPEEPRAAIALGHGQAVDFAIGANADETSMAAPALKTEAEYQALVTAQFGASLGAKILMQYPASAYKTPRAAYVAVTTDARFVCQARRVARAFADSGHARGLYRYHFGHGLDNAGALVKALGAYHGLELPFVFGTTAVAGYVPSTGEVALSDAMIGYWTRFAATGDPGGGGPSAPAWPAYDRATDRHLILDVPVTVGEGVRTAACDFWDELLGP